EDLPEIAHLTGLMPPFHGSGDGRFKMRLIDVADSGYLYLRLIHGEAHVGCAHGTDADKPHGEPVVGAPNFACISGRGQPGAGHFHEVSSPRFHTWSLSVTAAIPCRRPGRVHD